jgi:hypothetical protein
MVILFVNLFECRQEFFAQIFYFKVMFDEVEVHLISDLCLVEFAESDKKFPANADNSFFSKFVSKFISKLYDVLFFRVSEWGSVTKNTKEFDKKSFVGGYENKVDDSSDKVKVQEKNNDKGQDAEGLRFLVKLCKVKLRHEEKVVERDYFKLEYNRVQKRFSVLCESIHNKNSKRDQEAADNLLPGENYQDRDESQLLNQTQKFPVVAFSGVIEHNVAELFFECSENFRLFESVKELFFFLLIFDRHLAICQENIAYGHRNSIRNSSTAYFFFSRNFYFSSNVKKCYYKDWNLYQQNWHNYLQLLVFIGTLIRYIWLDPFLLCDFSAAQNRECSLYYLRWKLKVDRKNARRDWSF